MGSHLWLWSDWKFEPQAVLEVRSAVKKMFSLQTFMQRHGLQLKCSVHCYQPSDEQSFCLFSSLFEGQWAFRATEGQQHLKRLQMENKMEAAASVLRISITRKKKCHFLLFSLIEGTISRFLSTWCYLLNHFLLPVLVQPSTWRLHSQPKCWLVGIIDFNHYTSNNGG